MIYIRLLVLIVVLNVIRYLVIGLVEGPLILGNLFAAMERSKEYFNNDFSNFEFAASFFYNFVMWAVIVFVFHISQAFLKGSIYVRSFKVFGVMWLFFASVSAIYMNHYSHPKDFYIWSIVDGLFVYFMMALATGLLYPLFLKKKPVPDGINEDKN